MKRIVLGILLAASLTVLAPKAEAFCVWWFLECEDSCWWWENC